MNNISEKLNQAAFQFDVKDQSAERVIYGNFYTVDKEQPRAEAVAIFGGHFVYVGDAEGVKEYIGENTKVEHYEGGLIIPGMSDGHCHCSVGGTVELFEANLLKVFDVDEFIGRIKTLIEKHPEYEVYQGFGFLPVKEVFGPFGPTADMLDGLSDKPIARIRPMSATASLSDMRTAPPPAGSARAPWPISSRSSASRWSSTRKASCVIRRSISPMA